MRKASMVVILAAAVALAVASVQAQASPWVHVRVSKSASEGGVAMNLPLSVVEAVLRAAPQRFVDGGRLHLPGNGPGLSVSDLRTVWAELGTAGDAELVSVQHEQQTIRIVRQGAQIQVRLSGPENREAVGVDVPARVVDALLSGDSDELNTEAAIRELRTIRGDVVNIRGDDDNRVHVWIDESAS